MKLLVTGWIVAFALFLVAPLVQTAWPLVPEQPLHGVTVEVEKPSFGWASWFSGEFQQQSDTWFSRHIGFRPSLVRTDNQVGLSLFREVTARTADPVVLGLDNVLYQKSGLVAYNRLDLVSENDLQNTASKIRQLQDALAERGIGFLLVITPSKAEVYPEHIPEARLVKHRHDLKTNYQAMLPYLLEYEVNLVDAHDLFMAAKDTSPYPLFPPGGIHWNLYAAGLVTEVIIDKLETIMGQDLVNVRLGSVKAGRKARTDQFETDLADLLNVWAFQAADWEFPRARFKREASGSEVRPDLVIIGDSFSTAFPLIMEKHGFYTTMDFYWYFSSKTSRPSGVEEQIDRETLDFEKAFFSRDAIIVEIAEFMIGSVGWGFIDQALAELKGAE